jgi:hypothetical protein
MLCVPTHALPNNPNEEMAERVEATIAPALVKYAFSTPANVRHTSKSPI